MNLKMKLDENLFYTDFEAKNSKELLKIMGDNLFKKGYVKKEYSNSIIEREKQYPTGLPAEKTSLAIPHTDHELVNTTTVSVATLREPITFQNMADPDESIEVKIIFMLAIEEAKGQLEMLQRVMEIIQDTEFKEKILNVQSNSELLKIIENRLGGE